MKLNLSKVADTTKTDTTPKKISFTTTLENNAQQTESKTLSALNLNFSDVAEPEEIPNETGFNLTFVSGDTYDLDDIIFKKRRDNSDCPLIIKVDMNNTNDALVIKKITQMILMDYGVEYTDDNYKTEINKVPNFSDVFTEYFNKYYNYYYEVFYKANHDEGSISIDTVVEQLFNIHDGDYTNLYGDFAQTYAASQSNKPGINYEYGSTPEAGDDNIDYYTDIATNIKVIDNTLNLYRYNNPIPGNTPISTKTINGESIFGNSDMDLLTDKKLDNIFNPEEKIIDVNKETPMPDITKDYFSSEEIEIEIK